MSDQIVYGGTIHELDTAVPNTMSAYGNDVIAPAWSPSLIGAAGTAGKLRLQVNPGPGGGNKWTFNFKKNGATQFSVEIAGATYEGYDASTFAVAAGDRLTIEAVPDSGPAAAHLAWCWTWTPTTADDTIICPTIRDIQLSGTDGETICIAGVSPGPRSTYAALRFPMAGTLTAQYVLLSTAPGVGNRSRRFIVRVDGLAQASLNVDIAGNDTTGNATGASVAVADGQRVDIRSRCVGRDPAANASYVSIGLVFTPAYPDFFLVGAYSPDAMITGSGTEYRKPSSGGSNASWNSNYWTGFTVTHRVEIERMRVYLSALPASGTYTLATNWVAGGPLLVFDSGSAQSQLAVMPKTFNDGDDWATLYSATAVGGIPLSRASVCYACRVPADEGAPFTF